MNIKKEIQKSIKFILILLIFFSVLFITNPYIIPKSIQKIKLASEVSVEYVLLLDKLNKLEEKYSKNHSEKIQEKITKINTKLEQKYPEQISQTAEDYTLE